MFISKKKYVGKGSVFDSVQPQRIKTIYKPTLIGYFQQWVKQVIYDTI